MLVKVTDLSFSYAPDKTVLKNISFEGCSGEFVFIRGQSGAGKTTLLNILAGYIRNSTGTVIKPKDVSFVFQSYNILFGFSVLFNVALPLLLIGVKEQLCYEQAYQALKLVEANDLAERNPRDLSGGQLARVNLARAVVRRSQVILLDEPTGSLDSDNAVKILSLIKKLSRERLVIVVSHRNDLLKDYATAIYDLRDGCLVKQKRDVFSTPSPQQEKFPNRAVKRKTVYKLSVKMIQARIIRFAIATIFSGLSFGILLFVLNFVCEYSALADMIASQTFNYGFAEVAETIKIPIGDGQLSLTSERRLENDDFNRVFTGLNYSEYLSLERIIGNSIVLNSRDGETIDFRLEPYFGADTDNKSQPSSNHIESVINQQGLKALDFKSVDQINGYLHKDLEISSEYDSRLIKDIAAIDIKFSMSKVIKEGSLLNSPTIYYDYEAVMAYLDSVLLANVSAFRGETSLYERLFDSSQKIDLIGLKRWLDIENLNQVSSKLKMLNPNISLDSKALNIRNQVVKLARTLSEIVMVFLAFVTLGVFTLEFVIIRTIYEEEEQGFALYYSYNIGRGNFKRIFFGISRIFSGGISLISCAVGFGLKLFFQQLLLDRFYISFASVNALVTGLVISGVYLTTVSIASFSYRKIQKRNIIESLSQTR